MVCENPMLDEQREFVLHMQEPFFMGEVYFHDSPEDQDDFQSSMHELVESGEIPIAIIGKSQIQEDYFSIIAIHFFSEITMDGEQSQLLSDAVQEMANWYKQYLQWEEENDPFNE
jgi:hypothetical protein